MLWVKDGIDTKALPLMIKLLKYGNGHSDIVILEGIMNGEWYKDFSSVLKEKIITCEMDVNSIVEKVYADLLKEE